MNAPKDLIRYVGNPYVDAGVAVLELRLHKPCSTFTEDDLQAEAEKLKREYTKKIWKSYLMLHLPNCAWTQQELSSEKNQAYLSKIFDSHKKDVPELAQNCVFCDRPGKVLADRRFIPLLTGETVMACGAEGSPGLPVCGNCVLAVHFYPLATLKVEGKPLFWWTPDPEWTRRLNGYFYRHVQKILAASSEEFIKLRWPATQLLRAARKVLEEIESLPEADRPPLCDIIGIHATNYGADPNFDELRIPHGLLEFWSAAGALEVYRQVEEEAWENDQPKAKRGRAKNEQELTVQPANPVPELARRNRLYEALGKAFTTPDYRDSAKKVAAQFFLRRQGNHVAPNTIDLAEFFLEKVAGMEKERLDAIRDIADAIVEARDAKWIIDRLMRSGRSLYDFMPVMRSLQQRLSKEQKSIAWEKFLLALNLASDEDATARDTWLVSELVLIRIFERLGQLRSELLAEISSPEEVESSKTT